MRARLAMLPALGAAAIVPAPGTIFSVAGTTGPPRATSSIATATRLRLPGSLDALPDGGFVVADGWRVLRVYPDGRIATLLHSPRTREPADPGDIEASIERFTPPAVAAQADGSVLVAECGQRQVRWIAPDGRVQRVAGVGPGPPGFAGDGGPATAARLTCPFDIAADTAGGFVFIDAGRVRRVSSTGVISTIAGTGRQPPYDGKPPGEGGPATRAAIDANAVTVLRDGTVVLAESLRERIRSVSPDGTIQTLIGPGATTKYHGAVEADGLGAAPDGGFYVADDQDGSLAGTSPVIGRSLPDLRPLVVAGSGRYVTDPPRGDERRGDGGLANQADLIWVHDVAATADGGVIFTDGGMNDDYPEPGLVRYVTPSVPGLLAGALDRRDTRFDPSRPLRVAVTTTAPATVTVTARRRGQSKVVASVSAQVPAGRSMLTLQGELAEAQHVLALHATTATGAVAADRMAVLPVGWLSMRRARIYAAELVFTVDGSPSSVDSHALRGCRRFGARRIDCALGFEGAGCDRVVSLTLRNGRPWWGSYACPATARPRWRDRPRPLHGRDLTCSDDGRCPRRQP
jgi:hypothetical protein